MKKNENGGFKTELLKKGWWVAVTVKPGLFPLRCYVGEVWAVQEDGIVITTVDWLMGTASGWDLAIPWENFDGALVCTELHDKRRFGEFAATWADDINKQSHPAQAEEPTRKDKLQ
jgi:hypothetical protein